MNVINYLRNKAVAFEVLPYNEVQDASHLAKSLHSSGNCVSKRILTSADHGFRSFVAILSATHQIDLDKLSRCLRGAKIELVREEDLTNYCTDCEVGVVPPFGSQYGIGTIVDRCVAKNAMMLFEGNSLHEPVGIKYLDIERLENPLVGDFASPPA